MFRSGKATAFATCIPTPLVYRPRTALAGCRIVGLHNKAGQEHGANHEAQRQQVGQDADRRAADKKVADNPATNSRQRCQDEGAKDRIVLTPGDDYAGQCESNGTYNVQPVKPRPGGCKTKQYRRGAAFLEPGFGSVRAQRE
jgi:hypothetical protein